MRKTILTLIIPCIGLSLASALSLQEAKQLTLHNNTKYLAQKNATASAQWSKQQALGSLLPSATLSGSYVYLDPATSINMGSYSYTLNHDIRSAALTLSQPLFMGGKLWQAYRISSISAKMAELSLESTRLSILSEVETKYLNVLQLQDVLAISEKDAESSARNLAVAQIRYENGTISQADYLKAKSKHASKQVTLIQSQTALDLARQDLLNAVGLEAWENLEPINPSDEEEMFTTLAEYTAEQTAAFTGIAEQLSTQQNLSLKTLSATTLLSKKAYSIAKGSFLPTVMLSLSRSFKEDGLERYKFEATNTLALSASIPLLPLWNNYAASRKAWFDWQKSRADFETAADGINLSVRSSALNLISSAKQVNAAQTALTFTEQTYLQLEERFRNNMLSVTEMLDGEVMLQSARISYTNSVYNYLKARSALLLALGTDKAEILYSLMEQVEE